jgi:hypothetical protein
MLGDGAQMAAQPLIQNAAGQAQMAQRFGEQLNARVSNLTNSVNQQAQKDLAPAINASQSMVAPVLGAVNAVGRQAASGIGAGLELLGPGIVGLEQATAPTRVSAIG